MTRVGRPNGENGRKEARQPTVKTVEKALRILDHLATVRKELGVHEVARAVNLHPSTTYRLLAVLSRHQFLQLGSEPGRYSLGLRLAELGHAALDALELRAKARPVLEDLMAKTRETVHLMLLDGETGIYVDRVESPQRVRVASSLGQREHLHGSAVGKAILAYLPPERLESIIRRGLTRLTSRTITDPIHLRRVLREIVARGFALDNEEGEVGIRCVGAPIFDHGGRAVASLSVAGPAYRLSVGQLMRWGPSIREAANAVSAALGSRRSAPVFRRRQRTLGTDGAGGAVTGAEPRAGRPVKRRA